MNSIRCPFCSHEFETEFNWMLDDVECPECLKMIDMELDGDTESGFYNAVQPGQGECGEFIEKMNECAIPVPEEYVGKAFLVASVDCNIKEMKGDE